MIPAGSLRHWVTLQKQQVTVSTYGERTVSWVDVDTIRAGFYPLSVREFLSQSGTQSQVTARVVIRYRTGVDATMRLVHRDKVYNIAGVLPDPNSGREYLTLPVSEVTP